MIEFEKPKRKVTKVFIHCSASDLQCDQSVERIGILHTHNKVCKTTWNGIEINCKGWKEIGYHYYIEKSGKINICRNLENIPSAQKPYNKNSIAICVAGNKKFTEESFNSLIELCNLINSNYDKLTFHGHREVNKLKTCPNFDYKKILNLNEQGELCKNI